MFSVLAVSAKAQIPINTFFDVSTPNPIDGRFVIATLSDTSTITDLYDGLLTVVQNTDQLWQYDGTKWVQFQIGSSDNIYNTNGTIIDNRTVTVGSGNFLNITTQDGDGQIFIQDGIGLQLGGNTSTPGGRETVNFPNVGGGLQYGANYSNRAGFGNRTIPDWGYISEHTVDTLSSLADTTAAANNVGRIVHVVDVDQKWTVNSAGSWEALSGSGGTDDQTAAEVSVTPTGNLNSTDVQAALEEHQADIDALGAGGNTFDHVAFDTSSTHNVDVGEVAWNDQEGTLDVGLLNGSVLQIGQEQPVLVKNKTGFTIPDGTPLRFVGTEGNSGRILVAPAIADGSYSSYYNFGAATQEIPNDDMGYATPFGKIRGIELDDDNTNLNCNAEVWGDSTILYLDASTPGCYTKVKPTGANQKIPFAAIISAGNNGSMFVRPTLFAAIEDVSGVNIDTANLAVGQFLRYQNNLWENVLLEAEIIPLDDVTGYYTSGNIEGALQEIGSDIQSLVSGGSDGDGIYDGNGTTPSNTVVTLTDNITIGGVQINSTQDISNVNTINGTDPSTYLTSEVDGSVSNEGSLSVLVGASNTSVIRSNTSGSTDVTLQVGSNMTINESGNIIAFNALDDQTAAEVAYDNAGSGLSATNVKDALDELDSDVTANAVTAGNGITNNSGTFNLGGTLTGDISLTDGANTHNLTLAGINIFESEADTNKLSSNTVVMGDLETPAQLDIWMPAATNDIRGSEVLRLYGNTSLTLFSGSSFIALNNAANTVALNSGFVVDALGRVQLGNTNSGGTAIGQIAFNQADTSLYIFDGVNFIPAVRASGGSGSPDGVATAGTLDTGNEEIDITVNGAADFSIDISNIANIAAFNQFLTSTLAQPLILNDQIVKNGLTTPGISITDGGALVLPEATGTYSPSSNGELFYDSNQLQYRANGTTRVVNDWDDLLNIPSDLSDGTVTAAESSYSTTTSGLSSTTVQDAIDDIAITPNDTTLGAAATTYSIDLGNKQNHIELVSLTSTDTNDQIDLTVTNPKNGGVYTFHFIGADGEEIGWPSNFYYANETQMPQAGSPMTLTASDFFTCYYSSTNSRFYCK